MVILCLVLIVGALLVAFLSSENERRKRENMTSLVSQLSALEGFSSTREGILSADGLSGIAIDEGRARLCLINRNDSAEPYSLRLIGYEDVLRSEIYEGSEQVISTSRGSQFLGGVAGAALAGGPGLIVGGLSGKKRSEDKVIDVSLRLTVNDVQKPLHDVVIFGGGGGLENARLRAREWHGLMTIFIERARREYES